MQQRTPNKLLELSFPYWYAPAWLRAVFLLFGGLSWIYAVFDLSGGWFYIFLSIGAVFGSVSVVHVLWDWSVYKQAKQVQDKKHYIAINVDDKGFLFWCSDDKSSLCTLEKWWMSSYLVWLRFYESPVTEESDGVITSSEGGEGFSREAFFPNPISKGFVYDFASILKKRLILYLSNPLKILWRVKDKRRHDLIILRSQCADEVWRRLCAWLIWLGRGAS